MSDLLSNGFPEIKTFKVEVAGQRVSGKLLGLTSRDLSNARERIDCLNPICKQGGISIGGLVSSMVRERKTEESFSETCHGHEGSPQGVRRGRECICTYKIKITIAYKDAPAAT